MKRNFLLQITRNLLALGLLCFTFSPNITNAQITIDRARAEMMMSGSQEVDVDFTGAFTRTLSTGAGSVVQNSTITQEADGVTIHSTGSGMNNGTGVSNVGWNLLQVYFTVGANTIITVTGNYTSLGPFHPTNTGSGASWLHETTNGVSVDLIVQASTERSFFANDVEVIPPGTYIFTVSSGPPWFSGGTANDVTVNLTPADGKSVLDATITGEQGHLLPAVKVTLMAGTSVLAVGDTGTNGRIVFPEPAPDLTQLVDVLLEKRITIDGEPYTVKRQYQSVRLAGTTAATLVLPVTLHKALNEQFKKLDMTGTLVLGYDTTRARALLSDWNDFSPAMEFEHIARDKALGRLLSAAEGMAGAYTPSEAVALDAAKLVANSILSLASMGELAEEMSASAARAAANLTAQGTSTIIATTAYSFATTALKDLADYTKDSLVERLKDAVPAPQVVLVASGIETVLGGFAEAVSSGQWDRAGLNAGGKKAFMDGLAETLAEHVGGRILASAYVAANDSHLQTAVTRARNKDGTGLVRIGRVEALSEVGYMSAEAATAQDFSATADTVATQFGYVADLSQVLSASPFAPIFTAATAIIRGMSTGVIVTAAANDFRVFYNFTATDTPQIPNVAFFPSNSSVPPPAVNAFTASADKKVAEDGGSKGGVANALPSDYQTILSALRGKIVAADSAGILSDAQALLAADATMKAALRTALLQLKAKATLADPSRPPLDAALEAVQNAGQELFMCRGELYPSIAGWLLPEMGDPLLTRATLLAQVDAMLAAISAFNAATTVAETEADGLSTPGHLMVMEHGVTGASTTGRVTSGMTTLAAKVVNAGDATATGFTAQLTSTNPAGPVAILQINGADTQALADLAPGEARTVSWSILLTDISTNQTGSGIGYTVTLTGPGEQRNSATGSLQVTTSRNTEPVVYLKGANPLVIDAAPRYADAGATAFDYQEGDLTPVLVTNNVVSGVPGNYTVTYSATDGTGLTTTATRTVQVVANSPPVITAPPTGFGTLILQAGSPLPDYAALAVASDNSGMVTVTQSPPPGTEVVPGTLTITLTAKDAAGNQTSIQFTVTVSAVTGPMSDFALLPQTMWWRNDFTAHPTNGWLYGTCARGGIFNNGMIYRVNASGGYQTLVHFTNNGSRNKGGEPCGRLAMGMDGYFYGTTIYGGANGHGTVFKMSPEGELTTLVSLTGDGGPATGIAPAGGLVRGLDGNFYGTTQWGGTNGCGTIFKVTPQGAFTSLVSFTHDGATNRGSYPNCTLAVGPEGNLFGTTGRGGSQDRGTIFKVTPEGALTTLVELSGDVFPNSGDEPWGGLVLGPDSNFYGMTKKGGSTQNYAGSIFRITPEGVFTSLVSFSFNGATNSGRYPVGDLTVGPDGNLYGMTTEGGSLNLNHGTIFKVTLAGELTTLVEFTGYSGASKGGNPRGSLALGPDGNFYGTTQEGGEDNVGTVFKVTPAGVLTTLLESTTFTKGVTSTGGYPQGGICAASDGSLYGTTFFGGEENFGTIFKLDASGNRTTLIHFTGTGGMNRGSNPPSGLVLGSDGNFYGTTQNGGANDLGTIFKLTPEGVLSTLVEFTGNGATNKGSHPYGRLTLAPDGNLYGMANEGGDNNFGTIFRMTQTGELTTLLHFDASAGGSGAWPLGHLTVGPDGHLYGMANSGGANDHGTIFRITTAGVFTRLASFNLNGPTNGVRGGWPWGSLSVGPDGALYGMTNSGGSGFGTIFKVTTAGDFTHLQDFTGVSGATRGAYPLGTMIAAPDGFLYGTANSGGTYGMGTIFKMTATGTITTIVDFKGSGTGIEGGGFPYMDEFVIGPGNHLFGMTNVGGLQGGGMIYRLEQLMPEAVIICNGQEIVNNDDTPSSSEHTDFGVAALTGGSVVRMFTIQNAGGQTLTLGPVSLDGLQSSDFTVTTTPATSVAPGGSTSLGITFDPSQPGRRLAIVSLATNDVSENPFRFFISGTGNSAPLFVGQAFTTVQGKVTKIGEAKILPRAWDLDGQTVSITDVSATSAEGATVTRSGGTITYTPPPTFSGIDTFAITFTDGLTSVSGTVTMNVSADPGLNPANPPQLTAQPGGVMRLAFSGIPGRVYGIQRSTNLVNWTQIATPAANTQGAITIDDPAPPSGGAFYRIIFPPQ